MRNTGTRRAAAAFATIHRSESNDVPCVAPFTSTDGERSEIVGSREDWTPYLGGGSQAA